MGVPIAIGTAAGMGVYLSFPDPTLQGAAMALVVCIAFSMLGVWIASR